MRSKLQKRKAKQLNYRKNWKSCSTAKTRVRLLLPFLQLSFALRSTFETAFLTVTPQRQRWPGFFLPCCCCCPPLGLGRLPPPAVGGRFPPICALRAPIWGPCVAILGWPDL